MHVSRAGIGNCKIVRHVDSEHYTAKACAYSCHQWQNADGFGEFSEPCYQ